jgi:GNAT superfamily N-acetyltransferase
MNPDGDDLGWRLEAAFDAAWPGLQVVRAGDWLCKMARGVSRRANSANPLGPQARLTEPVIEACEAAYRTAGLPIYMRLPSLMGPEPDRVLAARGYSLEGGTLTLVAPLAPAPAGEAELTGHPTPEWLAALNALNGRDAATSAVFDAVLARLEAPAAFAAVRREGRMVSGAYGVLHGGWLCLEAVVTDPAWRGRGLAAQAVSALMGWGAAQGGQGAALQVTADNRAGRALYARLGFAREIYRYYYRRARP